MFGAARIMNSPLSAPTMLALAMQNRQTIVYLDYRSFLPSVIDQETSIAFLYLQQTFIEIILFSNKLGIFTTPDTEFDSSSAFGFNRHMYVGGFAGGFANGAITAWNQKASFGDGLIAGLAGGVLGGAAGIAGGLAGAGTTAALGNGFWATVASGAAGGMTGGFVGGYLGGRAAGLNGDDALLAGLSGAALGGVLGGILAGAGHAYAKRQAAREYRDYLSTEDARFDAEWQQMQDEGLPTKIDISEFSDNGYGNSMPFSNKLISRIHRGETGDPMAVDYSSQAGGAYLGDPVRSVGRGLVVFSKSIDVFGNTIVVHHGRGVYSMYAHLQSRLVNVGARVIGGELIGTIGSTGRSTGPHLHFEVFRGGINFLQLTKHKYASNPWQRW